jgi:outer membrane protein TolC
VRCVGLVTGAAPRAILLVLLSGVWAEAASAPGTVADEAATETPIELPTVLRLAGAQNLDIQIARQGLEEARARHRTAVQEFFPWVSPGFVYRRHDGLTQATDGEIVDVHKHSYSPGAIFAAQADVGAALFRSRETSKLFDAAQGGLEAQRAGTLLAAVEGYFDLARAQAAVEVARDAVRISRDYEGQLLRAVEIGLALKGEALRVRTQAERNELALHQALAAQRVTAARLAEVLRLDPKVTLRASDAELLPLSIVDASPTVESLAQKALAARPEVKAARAGLAAAREAKDGAVIGPLIPSLFAFAYLGGLGGGKTGAPGPFGGSRDYGLTVNWRIGPGGLFDSGRIQGSRARLEGARLEVEKAEQRVVREVVEAVTRVRSLADQIATAREGLSAAQEALRLSQERKEFGIAAVLEHVLAEQDLTRARNDYVTAVAEHDKAQYGLASAVGSSDSLGAGAQPRPQSEDP